MDTARYGVFLTSAGTLTELIPNYRPQESGKHQQTHLSRYLLTLHVCPYEQIVCKHRTALSLEMLSFKEILVPFYPLSLLSPKHQRSPENLLKNFISETAADDITEQENLGRLMKQE